MDQHSILKKQQWLVLICFLSGLSNLQKSAMAETQTQPSPISSKKEQESKIFSNALCDYQEKIRCFFGDNTSDLMLADDDFLPYKNSKIRSQVEPIVNFYLAKYQPEILVYLSILDILVYDNLTQMGNTETAQAFFKEASDYSADYSRSDTFLEFSLLIYRNHGGIKLITKFLHLLKLYFNQYYSNHYWGDTTFSLGERYHLWNEAAATDVRYIFYRRKKHTYIQQREKEFKLTQKRLTTYNYSGVNYFPNAFWNLPPKDWKIGLYSNTPNLTIRYSNEHVVYFSDEFVPISFKFPHKILLDSWQYVKETYGDSIQSLDPILYVILRTGNLGTCDYSFSERKYNFIYVIDCQKGSSQWLKTNEDIWVKRLVEHVGALTFISTSRSYLNVKLIGKDEKLLDILIYDIFVGIGRIADADQWSKTKADKTNNFPQKNTMWYQDWFLPIYINFGHTKTLQGFFTHLHTTWPEKKSIKDMNVGEIVHFWSMIVLQDLQSLAMETFGWQKKYSEELLQARIDYPQLNNLYTVQNSSLPQNWTKNWRNYNAESNLVYYDDHIAWYLDFGIEVSISWLFKLMSDSWKHAKKEYGPLSQDPILYIHFHKKSSFCTASKLVSYFDADYGNRNVIDCGNLHLNGSGFIVDSAEVKDTIIYQLGLLVLRNGRETGNWPGFASSSHSLVNIIVYDIYKGAEVINDAKRWHKMMFEMNEDISHQNSSWFRGWYFPIYQKYRENLAINQFLSVVNTNWPQQDQNYVGDYNMGEMVHFWSSAVGENLWPLADKAFGCCAWDQKTYLNARKEYPNFDYLDEYNNLTVIIPSENWISSDGRVNHDLRLVYVDLHFAAYFDSNVDHRTAWPFKHISKGWRYAKKTYGPFEPGAIMHFLIQSTPDNNCGYSRINSYQDETLEHRTVLSCKGSFSFWNSKDLLAYLLRRIGVIVLSEAKKTGRWPASFVSAWEMANLIAYDVLLEIDSPLDTINALKMLLKYEKDVPQEGTFWIRDWFYPIYINYGGANILNNFLNLLSKHWKRVPKGSGYDYVDHLNVGEFVHFWSGAAGVNLTYLANRTLKWNHEYNIQLEEAIKMFPMITYNDTELKVESNSALEVLTEDQFGHSELLLKVYGTSEITIYFDAEVNRAVKWPIDFLTNVWTQTKSNYSTVQNALDSHCTIFLHGAKHFGCKTSFKLPNNTERTNILDCGKSSSSSDSWAKNNLENRLDLIYGFAKLIQHGAQQAEGNEAYDTKPFSQILAYDILYRLGYFKDAHTLLNATYNETKIETGRGKFWIRDWYLPLYTQYGRTAILNKFLNLLSTTWAQKEERVANQKMNVGESIHFWSASAGTNLFNFSQLVFGRKEQHHVQFIEAKKDFPLLNYSCFDCDFYVIQAKMTGNGTMIFGVIASVAFACIVFAAFLISLAINRKKLKRLKQEMRELTPEEIKEFFQGNDKTDENEHFCIDSKPFNADYEISRESLDIDLDSALGSGEFGLVYRGLLKPTFEQDKALINTVVAVKTVKPNVNVTHFKTILTELKVMGYLGLHENIVSLLGAYTVNIKNREIYMALEFCSQGDLLNFLKSNRTSFEDWILKPSESIETKSNIKTFISISNTKPATVVEGDIKLYLQLEQTRERATACNKNNELQSIPDNRNKNITVNSYSTLDLLKWSSQIASGMEFIASKKVIHGDLAARNILLTEDNVAKISDFGLSRQLENYAFYMKSSKTPVPWRWLAIESLRDMKFSVQSDAWSFGVVLYEIFSLGTMPYAGSTWDYEFVDKLVAGHRLSAPEFGNEGVHKLMMDCMRKEPSERIAFLQAICRLEEIKVQICQERALNDTSEYLKLTS